MNAHNHETEDIKAIFSHLRMYVMSEQSYNHLFFIVFIDVTQWIRITKYFITL